MNNNKASNANTTDTTSTSQFITEDVHQIEQQIRSVEGQSTPVLPLRDIVIFAKQAVPIPVGRESSIALLQQAYENETLFVALTQKEASVEVPSPKDMYHVGTICKVLKLMEMPDGQYTAFIASFARVEVERFTQTQPSLRCIFKTAEDIVSDPESMAMRASKETLSEAYHEMLRHIPEETRREFEHSVRQLDNYATRVDYIAMHAPLTSEQKQALLEQRMLKKRAEMLTAMILEEIKYLKIRHEIQMRTQHEIGQQQRNQFLEQQIRVMQEELGNADDDDLTALAERAAAITWSEQMQARFEKELKRLERYNPQSPEYAIQYSYIDHLLSLPWDSYAPTEFTLEKVEEVLDRDHYGLREVKDRIVEQMAIVKQRGDLKSGIICLYGPPGVGKTSLGRSIAEALGREYARVSFGGLHDESEVRGHRKTYLGAMPGRIVAALQKCQTGNPVFVLDEIDKIGKDFKGDPSTALLEVLDPEQNDKFHDNYIDVDYDLSKVLFIATANTLDTISAPLRDRMELIEVSGYTLEEKVEIALRHLVDAKLRDAGLETGCITFEREAIERIIAEYTRESGVRQLDKKLSKVIRKLVRLKVSGKPYPTIISADMIPEYLGKQEVFQDIYEGNDIPGVVTGLAWTSAGGEILFIESSLTPGKGEKLTLTGSLGDVMKESATIALQYLKAHAADFGISYDMFTSHDVHIHVPEGAIPKDGPSAGITMATSLASSFLNCKVRPKLAMTGEITLRGKVLPVGGVKEKILAAKRAGITDIMLSSRNRKDIDDIDAIYLDGLQFHYVDTVNQVLDFALIH